MKSFRRARIIVIAIVFCIGFIDHALFAIADEASLYISPSVGRRFVGETFQLAVRVNTGGQSINAAEGSIVFNAQKVQVVSISKSGSVFTLWTGEPSFSNADGTISFSGGLPSPGYAGSNGLLFTVTFRGISATTLTNSTNIVVVSGAILANDGAGTNILTSLGRSSFFIAPLGTEEEPEDPEATSVPISSVRPSPAPSEAEDGPPNTIRSQSHPDQSSWYADTTPTLHWDLSSDVSEVRLVISRRPNSNPFVVYRPPITEKTLETLDEGVWYLNARFMRTSGSSVLDSYRLQIDATPPDEFEVRRLDSSDPTNPRPELSFVATDELSGIDHYEIDIADKTVVVSAADGAKAYMLPALRPGKYTVLVRAYDRAGNNSQAGAEITIVPIEQPTIDEVSKKIAPGEELVVRGRASVGHSVVIRVAQAALARHAQAADENIVKETEVPVSQAGTWEAAISGLSPGKYVVYAFSKDHRGATSEDTESVPARIQERFGFLGSIFRKIVDLFAWAWKYVLITLYVVAVSLVLHFFLWHRQPLISKLSGFKKRIVNVGALRRSEVAASKHLDNLMGDIDKELQQLKKITKHRPLYPEEKYLKDKLNQYQKTLKELNKKK